MPRPPPVTSATLPLSCAMLPFPSLSYRTLQKAELPCCVGSSCLSSKHYLNQRQTMKRRGRPRTFDREEALDTALRLFWCRGYDKPSIADLTEAMGLKPPSLYAAFGSKEALFKEALDRYISGYGGGIWHHLEESGSARDAFYSLLQATAEAYSRGSLPRGCMIVLSAPQPDADKQKVGEMLRDLRLENQAQLEARLQRAVREGELPASVDTAGLASFFACVQHGMSIQARDGAPRETLLSIAAGAAGARGGHRPDAAPQPPGAAAPHGARARRGTCQGRGASRR